MSPRFRNALSVLLACCFQQVVSSAPPNRALPTARPDVALKFFAPSDEFPRGAVHATGMSTLSLAALVQSDLSRNEWAAVFPVRTAGRSRAAAGTTILGTYEVWNVGVRFTPRFAWQRGIQYEAEFLPASLPERVRDVDLAIGKAAFHLPKESPATPTMLAELYPSSPVLPENLLKFYLHFSRPMSRGKSYQHVALHDEAGRRIVDPFLELGEELWDDTGKRFTLLLDPGRIKHGLRPHIEEGPVFEAGKNYTLRIQKEWLDETGNPLGADFEKQFTTTQADLTQPDIKQWQIALPTARSREALTVEFAEPLDHAMLHRVINVRRNGKRILGEITTEQHESSWAFRPQRPWKVAQYTLVVETTLEDLSGNSLGRPFEVNMQQPQHHQAIPKFLERPFEIRSP